VDQHSATVIASRVRNGELSARDVVRGSLDRIAERDGSLHAFLEVFEDHAMARAAEIDAKRARGEPLGPLAGVPVAIKDNICFDHGKTTCASRMLEHYQSPYTATALRRLLDAGAVVVGKTNLDEFAMGSSCEHSAFGPTKNPFDITRVPGGSSGGSAAAVAAGMIPLALGSDTGGSIRQPAALCGVVGFKPTYGRVSRFGLVAYASSLDQIGPLAASVEDCALCVSVMARHDPLDATSSRATLEQFDPPPKQPQHPVLGVPGFAREAKNDPDAWAVFERTIATIEAAGAEVREIDLPHADHTIAAYYILAPAEASSNLARYDGIRYGHRSELAPGASLEILYTQSRAEGFGREVQRRIMLGTHVLSSGYYDAYYLTALKARRLIKQDYDNAFLAGCDAVLMPTTPGLAFRLGEKLDDPLTMYAEDLYTIGANLAGLPAISVPAGVVERDGSNLPVGVQLVGPALGEVDLFQTATLLEHAIARAEHS
jgi:aspartyl-tRNA(Asn)/glutamyl-tRNA(Gln) amidotransferase subunit A